MSSKGAIVVFQPYGKRVRVEEGTTLFEAAQMAGVNIRSVCGGKGTCGKCKVIVERGEVSDSPSVDRKFLTSQELSEGYHLACQTRVIGDAEVDIPLESRIEGQQILTRATISSVEFNPRVRKLFLDAKLLASFETIPEGMVGATQREFSKPTRMTDTASAKLNEILVQKDQGLTVTTSQTGDGLEVVDVEVGDTSGRNYGLAIDVGTTKVAMYLVDLNDGEIVDVGSEYNRQLVFGEDLLSRIDYAYRVRRGLTKLQRAVVKTINSLVEEIASRNKVETSEIMDVCVSGNTVMTYMLAGLDPSPLVRSNVAVSRDPVEIKAERLEITANQRAWVFCLPNVSRFVGGDAVGDVLASGLFESPEISVLIDMGTNGEVILGSKGWLFSSSCAAGPAFEGWGIRFGMRSVEGAIEHLKINPETLRSSYAVIGGSSVRPRGLCGSGLIDAMAEMFKAGLLDALGKIQVKRESPLVRRGLDGLEYVVVPAAETDINRDIVITQRDVDNLMDSKAATCAAVSVLMKKVGLKVSDVENLYLSGAFGNYMDPESAVTIGIFPDFENARVVQLGNGAIAGAYLALMSVEKREEAVEIAETMTYYDLTADPDFMDEYSAAFFLPGKPELFPRALSQRSR